MALEQSILRQDPDLAKWWAKSPGTRARRTWGSRRTARLTARRSSDASPRSRPVWHVCATVAPAGRSSGPPGAASPPCCGPGSPRRYGATALARWCSPPAGIRWTHSPQQVLAPASVVLVDQAEEAFSLCDGPATSASASSTALVAHTETRTCGARPCGPTTRATSPATPGLAALVERGLFLLGPMSDRLTPGRDRGPRPAARPGARAGAHRPAGPRDRGRAGSAAAAVPRPARDVAPPRGPDADGRRLPGVRRGPRCRRPVGRGVVRRARRRRA